MLKSVKKVLMWCFLLLKRFLKKPAFVAILLLVPLLVGALGLVASEESGILTVALAVEDCDDNSLAKEVKENLISGTKLIRYIEFESPAEAIHAVSSGKAEGAWILPADMEKRVEDFSKEFSESDYIVDVYEREDSVIMKLAREKLYAAVFGACSKEVYINFIRENFEGSDDFSNLSDEALLEYYDGIEVDGSLFEFASIEGGDTTEKMSSANYMTSPIRGLLSVLTVLCGLATALFYMQDREKGLFSWVSVARRPWVAFGYHLLPISVVAVAALLSMFIIGVNVAAWREIVSLVLFVVICTEFCTVIRLFCKNVKVLGAVLPIIIIGLIAVCPVFYNAGSLLALQIFLPPFYYINAAYNGVFLLYMVIYAVVGGAVCGGLARLLRE